VAVVGDAVDEDAPAGFESAAQVEAPQRLGEALGVGSGDRHFVDLGAE
jgi:hypothetical protein